MCASSVDPVGLPGGISERMSATSESASNQPFKVGSEATVDPIDGAVSMIRVYGQALTDDEVTTNFNSIKNVYGL